MKTVRTPDATWLALRQSANFQPFFDGLIEHLKKNLQQITVAGSHEYYTCGEIHDKRNPHWKPFDLLWAYCEDTGYDFYEAKDMIEEKVGRKLLCECELLNDDRAIRRKELEVSFGVDFGAPGKREVDVV